MISTEYINNSSPLILQCQCGNNFKTTYANFKKEKKYCCDNCTWKKVSATKRFSQEYVSNYLLERGYILLSEYTGIFNKIIIIDKDGYKYFVEFNSIKVGSIPSKFHQCNPFTVDNLILWLRKKNSNTILLSKENINSNKKLKFKCKKCDYIWEALYSNVLKNEGCPACASKVPTESNNLLFVNPELSLEWNYDKNSLEPKDYLPFSNKKVWWICKDCGHEWQSTINNRSGGRGCPKCRKSQGEKLINEVLLKYNVQFERQYWFKDCRGKSKPLKFDFAIINNNYPIYLIEYDGELHYRPYRKIENSIEKLNVTQEYDKIKNEYCKKHNIPLLRIPYWEKDNIEQILTKELNLKEAIAT